MNCTTTDHRPPTTDHSLPLSISWLLPRDLDRVVDIERSSFSCPWTRQDFLHAMMADNGVIGYAAEVSGELAGYLIREYRTTRDKILNIAVDPALRRRGVGRALVRHAQQILSRQQRTRIVAECLDTNLDAQLFFRAMGFEAVKILRDHYPEAEGDAYRFLWKAAARTAETRRARR